MVVKQKILSQTFLSSNYKSNPQQDRQTHIESNCCPKRLRAGITTGLIAVGPSEANWFWQLMWPELLVTNSPYN